MSRPLMLEKIFNPKNKEKTNKVDKLTNENKFK
jgi:hypothetical protein